MSARIHPSYRRVRVWPFVIHYTKLPPRVTSIAFHVLGFTHNFYTHRNTLAAHDLGSLTWGDERRPRRRK